MNDVYEQALAAYQQAILSGDQKAIHAAILRLRAAEQAEMMAQAVAEGLIRIITRKEKNERSYEAHPG